MAQKKIVLFLCTINSCRSQMAEGFLRHMGGDKFEVFSAGVKSTQGGGEIYGKKEHE